MPIAGFVYVLKSDGIVFYVGQTRVGKREPERYLKLQKLPKKPTRLAKTIIRFKKQNKILDWEIIEECEEHDLDKFEIFHISSFRAAGAIIANSAGGGASGRPRGIPLTQQQIENVKIGVRRWNAKRSSLERSLSRSKGEKTIGKEKRAEIARLWNSRKSFEEKSDSAKRRQAAKTQTERSRVAQIAARARWKRALETSS